MDNPVVLVLIAFVLVMPVVAGIATIIYLDRISKDLVHVRSTTVFLEEIRVLLARAAREYERSRDLEWCRALGITGNVLTPDEAAKWLENDRVERARNVHDARPRRTPPNCKRKVLR
jgi:hypothetical protein